MRCLRRFAQLSGGDWAILLLAAFSLALVQLTLRGLPLTRVLPFLTGVLGRSKNMAAPVDRIVWATPTAARFIPGSTCLIQALAAQALLIRFGYKPRLTIGVAKNQRGGVEAHAWVSCDDQLLIGGPRVERYNSLLDLDSVS